MKALQDAQHDNVSTLNGVLKRLCSQWLGYFEGFENSASEMAVNIAKQRWWWSYKADESQSLSNEDKSREKYASSGIHL